MMNLQSRLATFLLDTLWGFDECLQSLIQFNSAFPARVANLRTNQFISLHPSQEILLFDCFPSRSPRTLRQLLSSLHRKLRAVSRLCQILALFMNRNLFRQ
jgi:hypothetical protein